MIFAAALRHTVLAILHSSAGLRSLRSVLREARIAEVAGLLAVGVKERPRS